MLKITGTVFTFLSGYWLIEEYTIHCLVHFYSLSGHIGSKGLESFLGVGIPPHLALYRPPATAILQWSMHV